MTELSQRGRALLQGSLPDYLLKHFARQDDRWSTDNPDGYLGLCVAENALVWDLFEERVRALRAVPPARFAYDEMRGCARFREQLARFLGEHIAHRPIDAEHILALAGAGAVLETVFYALGDPGDGVLVPTPSYAGFWMDLEVRNALTIVPVHGKSEDDFHVGPDLLQHALDSATRPIRALLLTNPDNPRGAVLDPETVRANIRWASARGLHVVVDEVYALSVFGKQEFCSVLSDPLRSNVHVVWAFSKDFAASGLRCGVLVSENPHLRDAVDGLAYWSCVSGDTQFLLGELLDDRAWLERYLDVMPQRLRHSYNCMAEALSTNGIPYHPASAGFFVLADFRRWLPEHTHDAADRLWERFVDDAKVNFTPGSACRISEPGFMRICHTATSSAASATAIARVNKVLGGRG